jgi:hypothetical protein
MTLWHNPGQNFYRFGGLGIFNLITELLPAPLPGLAQSSLPPEEKRRHLIDLVVHSVPAQASKRTYRTGVEQFFDWWGAAGV